MPVIYRDILALNNSKVLIDIYDSVGYEDIAIFRAEARQHEKVTGKQTQLPSTYRTIKDSIIKGE